jgi:hypothetical protein
VESVVILNLLRKTRIRNNNLTWLGVGINQIEFEFCDILIDGCNGYI